MKTGWKHWPTAIAWGIGIIGSIALLGLQFLASGGAALLQWVGG